MCYIPWNFIGLSLAVVRPTGVYLLDYVLLRYSVLCTVESLSLLHLLFISWCICSRRWCMDKLGVFHANHTSMCLDPHLNKGRETGLSPLLKYFYWPFQGGTSFIDHFCYLCLVFVMFSRLSIAALWSPEGKGLNSWLLFVMFIVIWLLSHFISWDRCGTWLYQFLIIAVFLTL